MTAPTKTARAKSPELPLEEQTSLSGGALVKTGAPPVGDVRVQDQPQSAGIELSIGQLLQLAIEKGTPVEQLSKLVELHERVADRNAALEFARALAAFQQDCPPIGKVKTAKITTSKGGSYEYTYAPLSEIARIVKPILAQHGLSYGWNSAVAGGSLTCDCTLYHVNGHSKTASFTLPIDNPSAMSPQQKVGAALTFAQRKTLESVLGLNTTDEDTDAIAREIDPTPINDDQLLHLEELLGDTAADPARFLKYLGIDRLAALPAVRYKEAVAALQQKREKKGGAK